WSAAITANAGAQWAQFGVPTGFGYESQIAGVAESPGGATVLVGYYDYVGAAQAGTTSASPTTHGASTEWWNAVTAVAGAKFWVVGDEGRIAASSNNGAS